MERRTDLAVELKEDLQPEKQSLEGIEIKEKMHFNGSLKETKIEVTNETGEKLLGKPKGSYITLESSELQVKDENYHKNISQLLSSILEHLLNQKKNIFIVGLGNRNVTPDALGPYVIDHLNITRHLQKEGYLKKGKTIYALAPGVMAQTGMETFEIIQSIVKTTKPDVIIAIDALAARSSGRLNRTIQISDTGISPGAGVGNQRMELCQKTLGCKVIAIGVPTVIAVPTIICDAMENMLMVLDESLKKMTARLTGEEQFQLASELISPYFSDMFVTPKNIDEEVLTISYTISEAINLLS